MSEGKIVKEYSNGDVTVVWQPHLCIHSTICFSGLPEVFNPNQRPWVKIAAADTARIVEQVKQCPSGALSYRLTQDPATTEAAAPAAETVVELLNNGPLLIHGNVVVKDAAGNQTRRANLTAFCRCGASQNKPFCDGSHSSVGFEG